MRAMTATRSVFLTALTALALLALTAPSGYAAPRARDFQGICDSLRSALRERTGVDQELSMSRVRVNGKNLDLYFSSELSYYPWHEDDVQWFRAKLLEDWNSVAKGYGIGRIFTNRYELHELVLPPLRNNGHPVGYERSVSDPRRTNPVFIVSEDALPAPLGLDGRYIALWQSHGLYYDEQEDEWQWQRACMHRTVEDMFTPSFVLPFLIPMLENAGAYVLTPRERDLQRREIITDNDPAFTEERSGETRRSGVYRESGRWKDAGSGFADFRLSYSFDDNPFTAGSARMAECTEGEPDAVATWTAEIEERGRYAVYISYKSLANSCEAARYTVRHMGGESHFTVNQKLGGSTWIYLGTFEFSEGDEGHVRLDNRGPAGSVVTADAVKIGGGVGKLERGGRTSGVASSTEGAHYWMQWAGVDKSITRNWDTDYTNDFASRGTWTAMMKEQKGIPIDLSLAFHTDAGSARADTTIGTLAIYTLRCDGEREFSDGRDRIISRLLCDYVQTQVVEDIREDFDPEWTRRGIWDRSYSESRTTGVPAMLLELLSHQNFADMKYGLDPAFRFTVCRAVYKGILKTLSEFYGCDYVVQPLPVRAMSLDFTGERRLRLSWQPTPDPKEATAGATGYIVYTRIDDGVFDKGVQLTENFYELSVEPGHIYSFKVEACNDGGRSFPSEILSAGIPADGLSENHVLIVNNFDRISAPAWIDTPDYAGFNGMKDSGVPYIMDIAYIGENFEFDRSAEFMDNLYSGFGATHDSYSGKTVAGNTFDFPYIHGKSLMQLGYAFCSMSREAFCGSGKQAFALDLICGKQARTRIGRGAVEDRFEVFPAPLREELGRFASEGGHIFLSGSNIASDAVDGDTSDFLSSLFGYALSTPDAGQSGKVGDMAYSSSPNPEIYSVECPDGLKAVGKQSGIWLRHTGSRFGASVYSSEDWNKTVALAVPLETFFEESDRTWILDAVMRYFSGEDSSPIYTRR